MQILGIDIGGSGIKGAPVLVREGKLAARRYRVPTPEPSTPEAVAEAVAAVAAHFGWRGPIGCTFPAVVKKGVVHSAANVDRAWVGTDGRALLRERIGCPVRLLNDADAAGLAEMRFGAGTGLKGVVLVLTFGTGIGSALFVDGNLVRNTELGHLQIFCRVSGPVEAESYASDRARKAEDLDWAAWAARVSEYLALLEGLLSPDLFIVGGGVSRRHKEFLPLLRTRTRVMPARLRNDAGIIGAALVARPLLKKRRGECS